MWILVALMAPPCQETNPDFDQASGTEGATDTGLSVTTTNGATSAGADAADADAGSTSATATSDADSTVSSTDATSSPPDATGSAATTDGDPDTGGTTDGCEDPMVICFGQCVDTMMDPNHCGSCGNKCNPAQEACVMGECVPD